MTPSSQSVNSKLELLSNVYGGRMVIVDRDLKVVADTYHVDEGRTLISPKVVKCLRTEKSQITADTGRCWKWLFP